MHVDLETTKGLGLRIRGCIIICTKVNEFKLSTLRYFKLKNFGLCQKMICKIICNMPKARTGVLKLWWIMEFSIGKSQKIEPIFQFMKKNCQRNLKFWTLLTSRVLKFIYSEKATIFCEISTVDLSYVVTVKSTMEIAEISQNFVAFSENMKFITSTMEMQPIFS